MIKFIILFIPIFIHWIIKDYIKKSEYKKCNGNQNGCDNWMCKHSFDCYYSLYCKVGDGDYYLPEMEREYKKSLKDKERQV